MAFVMARLHRLNRPKIFQHMVRRGNNRLASFFAEQDYREIKKGSSCLIYKTLCSKFNLCPDFN